MRTHDLTPSSSDTFPLLDNEFDKLDTAMPFIGEITTSSSNASYELAWDEQLDSGHEMSL